MSLRRILPLQGNRLLGGTLHLADVISSQFPPTKYGGDARRAVARNTDFILLPNTCHSLTFLAHEYEVEGGTRRFVASNRELKRLDSLAMSPIFGMFSETLQGLTSVRAFRMQTRFLERHNALLDLCNQCWWPLVSTNRWLSIRLEFIGTCLVFCTAVASAVLLPRR
jgi:hypothetical protein